MTTLIVALSGILVLPPYVSIVRKHIKRANGVAPYGPLAIEAKSV